MSSRRWKGVGTKTGRVQQDKCWVGGVISGQVKSPTCQKVWSKLWFGTSVLWLVLEKMWFAMSCPAKTVICGTSVGAESVIWAVIQTPKSQHLAWDHDIVGMAQVLLQSPFSSRNLKRIWSDSFKFLWHNMTALVICSNCWQRGNRVAAVSDADSLWPLVVVINVEQHPLIYGKQDWSAQKSRLPIDGRIFAK